MADQRVTYEQVGADKDSGARLDEEAIKPVYDGETLRQNVLRRPTENLRDRTEVVRNELETLKYTADTNIKWIISGGASDHPQVISWDPTGATAGEVRFLNDLCIQPLASIAADRVTTFSWYFADMSPTNGTLTFTNYLTADKGGDSLAIRLSYSPVTNTLNIVTIGSPVNIIEIEISNDGSKTVSDLRSALLALPEVDGALVPPNSLVRWRLQLAGDSGTTIDSSTGTVPIAGTYDTLDTANREIHVLPAATWAAWNYAVGADPHPINDGDTVGIYYPNIIDPASFFDPTSTAHSGRRQRYGMDTDVVASDLFISSDPTLFDQPGGATVYDGPAKLPLCIPICKRIGNDLLFFDGTFVRDPADLGSSGFQPLYFGENAFTVDRLTGTGVALVAYSLAGASSVTFSLVAGTLQANLEDMADSLNSKGSLNANEIATESWTFDVTGVVALKENAILAYGKGGLDVSSVPLPDKINSHAAIRAVGSNMATQIPDVPGLAVLGIGGNNTLIHPNTLGGFGGIFLGGDNLSTGLGGGGYGVVGVGGYGGEGGGGGGIGVWGQGCQGNLLSRVPGIGGTFNGGDSVVALSSIDGGVGITVQGGSGLAASASGGKGIDAQGGVGLDNGGVGIIAVGGSGSTGGGGVGVHGTAGTGDTAILTAGVLGNGGAVGYGVHAASVNNYRSALHLVPTGVDPSILADGDIWVLAGGPWTHLSSYGTCKFSIIPVTGMLKYIPITTGQENFDLSLGIHWQWTDPVWQSRGNNAELFFNINGFIPQGAIIVDIRVSLKQGSTTNRTPVGNRTRFELIQRSSLPVSDTVYGTGYSLDTGGSHTQILSTFSPPLPTIAGGDWFIKIYSGVDTPSHFADFIYAVAVKYRAGLTTTN